MCSGNWASINFCCPFCHVAQAGEAKRKPFSDSSTEHRELRAGDKKPKLLGFPSGPYFRVFLVVRKPH